MPVSKFANGNGVPAKILKPPVPKFVIEVGKNCSYYDSDKDQFFDAEILEILNNDKVEVKPFHAKGKILTLPRDLVEPPLQLDVNSRFEYYEQLLELACQKRMPSLFVTGEGGIGKTFTLMKVLEKLGYEEDIDYQRVKGHVTPMALFQLLRDNYDQLIIFDDADSAFKTEIGENILKAVLDSYDVRKVKWLTSRDTFINGSREFTFTGSVVFLSNLNRENVDYAILSRSICVGLEMDTNEKIVRMKHILPGMEDTAPGLSYREKLKVLAMIDRYKNTIENLNIRTLVKGLKVFEETHDLELTRYQILNS